MYGNSITTCPPSDSEQEAPGSEQAGSERLVLEGHHLGLGTS
jgi:hypothetical protein